MDAIRDVLKAGLGRSLRALGEEDRLSAAWRVVCGRALAEHGEVVGYSSGRMEVEVVGAAWLDQFRSMRAELETEIACIAEVPVTGIHFVLKR
jgi:hypothetical protein